MKEGSRLLRVQSSWLNLDRKAGYGYALSRSAREV
jgi:hypothetical protein